jgi:hypothetical protein
MRAMHASGKADVSSAGVNHSDPAPARDTLVEGSLDCISLMCSYDDVRIAAEKQNMGRIAPSTHVGK